MLMMLHLFFWMMVHSIPYMVSGWKLIWDNRLLSRIISGYTLKKGNQDGKLGIRIDVPSENSTRLPKLHNLHLNEHQPDNDSAIKSDAATGVGPSLHAQINDSITLDKGKQPNLNEGIIFNEPTLLIPAKNCSSRMSSTIVNLLAQSVASIQSQLNNATNNPSGVINQHGSFLDLFNIMWNIQYFSWDLDAANDHLFPHTDNPNFHPNIAAQP